ncbi:unnamed protein product [Caenorhabditis angaria]|uniref:GPI transamidase subunit PIG-U n=1 Tax=Caenorhabditis angaria TaxID=860376 RepID=A0A9P1I8U8_9PELO|nr:unnamed protein product [Caenorhabditis angaria]
MSGWQKIKQIENDGFLFKISFAIVLRSIAFQYSHLFAERVELNSPFYSFNHLNDGVALLEDGFDPYSGNDFNLPPISLYALYFLQKYVPNLLPTLWILMDISTALILSKISGTKTLMPFLFYAFNPISIASCSILSLTIPQNLLIAMIFWAYRLDYSKTVAILIGFWSSFTLYPLLLIFSLIFVANHKISAVFLAILAFFAANLVNFVLNEWSWSFLDSTYQVILNFTNIQPNVGLHWYFFVQVFEHFRTFYTSAFTILYFFMGIPLTLIIRNDKEMHFISILLLITTFFPYPTLNSATICLALLPVLEKYRNYFRYTLLVPTTLITTIALMPVMWHMWIVSSSGNANFFFGATLTYNVALIYLIMDLIFVYSRRQIDVLHGDSIKKQAKFGYSFY